MKKMRCGNNYCIEGKGLGRRLAAMIVLVCLVLAMAGCGAGGMAGSGETDGSKAAADTGAVDTGAANAGAADSSGNTDTKMAAESEVSGSGAPMSGKGMKIALVVDGNINDRGWCQLAYEALLKAERELGAQIAYSEKTQASDYETVIGGYAAAGFNMVIAHGAEFFDTCKTLGTQYPDTQFIITSSTQGQEPNVNGVFVGVYESGFINGAAAALMSENGKIGVIGGIELSSISAWVEGAKAGALYVNPDVYVSTIYTGSFDDASKAREAAYALIEGGCDVITQNADASSEGAIIACDEKGVVNIGAVSNQDDMGEKVAFSVIQDTTTAIYDVILEGCEGKLKGQGRSVGVSAGCVYLTEFKEWVPENVRSQLEEIVDGIGSGAIVMEDQY